MNNIPTLYKRKLKYSPLDYFGFDSTESLHWGKLFVSLFGSFFSTYSINHSIESDKLISELIDKWGLNNESIIRIERSKKECFTESDPGRSEVFLIIKNEFCVCVHAHAVHVLYGPSIDFDEVRELATTAEMYKTQSEKIEQRRKFYMVSRSDHGGLELMDFEVKNYDIDLESNYNDDFLPVHQTIVNTLNENNSSGLVLLHGCFGSGKTYYIRHLISSMRKKFIYLPLHMAEYLSSPEFLPLITQHTDSILILEDCENYLLPRKEGNCHASALSNLLNISDGLLSDALSISIICTFNENKKNIDAALLRKGRLIARYEFKELAIDKANRLSAKLGKNVSISQPMTLAGIYNSEKHDYEMIKSSGIGFSITKNAKTKNRP